MIRTRPLLPFLDDAQVEALLRKKATGAGYQEVMEEYALSKSTLHGILSGKQYPEFDSLRRELGLIA